MSAAKILWGQIAIVFAIVLIAVWAATQWTAWRLGLRARIGRVLRFDPTSQNSAAYNLLLEVRRGIWEVRDVQNVADVLVDPEGSLERRNHREKTSHSLLVGAILHVLYAEPDKTLAGVANFLSDPRRPINTTLNVMMTTAHLGQLEHRRHWRFQRRRQRRPLVAGHVGKRGDLGNERNHGSQSEQLVCCQGP
jgi:type IV secretory pathway TraG/TraD family ATPase VirD4